MKKVKKETSSKESKHTTKSKGEKESKSAKRVKEVKEVKEVKAIKESNKNTPVPGAAFPYIHGFSVDEQERLRKQAQFAEFHIFQDINFSEAKNIIEVGCGVGAQTEILMRRFPKLKVTSIDLNERQLAKAKANLKDLNYAKGRFHFQQMDAANITYDSATFDGAFLCWVLEHVPSPEKVLSEVRRVVRPGGKIVVNEVMNSSFFLEPYSPNVWRYWMAFNDFQLEHAGDPFVGAKLGNLLMSQGYRDIETTVKVFHYDNRWPEKRREVVEFWRDLLLSAADELIKSGVVDLELVQNAKRELETVSVDPNAVFHYSFMQAKAMVY